MPERSQRNHAPSQTKPLLSVREAAKLLGVSQNFFYTHKELPSYRIGRSLRFDVQELREWFRRQAMLGR